MNNSEDSDSLRLPCPNQPCEGHLIYQEDMGDNITACWKNHILTHYEIALKCNQCFRPFRIRLYGNSGDY